MQVADVALKLAFAASVICTCVLAVVTWIGVGAAGVGVLGAVVEILAGVEAKFVTVKINGPPKEPAVVFCKAKVGGLGALV